MKSMLTYDMHNYAATDAPNIEMAVTELTSTKASGEKYSLRQRHKRKLSSASTDNNNNNNNNNNNDEIHLTSSSETPQSNQLVNCRKRSTKRCIGMAPTTTTATSSTTMTTITTKTKATQKAKTKAAPLSKYRRKTANARERTRMREINTAFERLRFCVPPTISGEDTNQTNDKLTKITTLRFAMKYIDLLSEALENPSVEENLLHELKLQGDHRFTSLDYAQNQNEQLMSFTTEEPTIIPAAITNTTTKANKNKNKTNNNNNNAQKLKSLKINSNNNNNNSKVAKSTQIKRTTKKQQRPQKRTNKIIEKSLPAVSLPLVLSPASTSSSAYSSQYSNISFSSNASTTSDLSNTSSIFDGCLNAHYSSINQLLESDGESLHLSEHCLSPLEVNNNSNIFSTTTNSSSFASFDNISALATLENPLELSLRLLEPQVSDHQQPSACLDALTPFCDLLPADFPEHSALDMFLT